VNFQLLPLQCLAGEYSKFQFSHGHVIAALDSSLTSNKPEGINTLTASLKSFDIVIVLHHQTVLDSEALEGS
jgi:hypothetical protein